MRDQPSGEPDEPSPNHLQQLVLHLLREPGGPPMWTLAELGRELGSELQAADAVADLHGAGLVHRCHEFVFPTRATTKMLELTEA
jgi:hypothetical protein